MTTLLEPKVTLAYLAYLGYPHSSSWSSFASSHPPSPSAVASSASRTSYPFSSSTPSSGAGPSSSSAGQSSSSSSSGAHDSASYQLLPTTSALQVTKPRRPSRRKGVPVERNVFLAYVLGAAGSGKTSLLRAFVGKGFEEEDGLAAAAAVGGAARAGGRVSGGGEWAEARGVARGTAAATSSGRGKGKSVVNCVEEGGGERYLVVSGPRLADSYCPESLTRALLRCACPSQLQEFGSTYESEVLRNKKKLELADVLVFVYDSSDTNSFSYVSNLRVCLPLLFSRFIVGRARALIPPDRTPSAVRSRRAATVQARRDPDSLCRDEERLGSGSTGAPFARLPAPRAAGTC